jgi:2-methylcitrate dehydratase PrpD
VDYLGRLAACVAATRFEALPVSTVAAARLVLLDTLGAIVAGSAMPENGRLARFAASRAPGGRATLLGHRDRADAFWAALTNATAGVALEVDEGSRLGGGHPAIHVVPGALAVAEERRLGGRRLIESVVAGYEIGSRIGGATTVRANVHSHGTWGTISTAVAVAKLGGAGAGTVRAVMNLAASMSPAGTILAERFEPELAVAGLDTLSSDSPARGPFRIEQNYFKLHACCRFNHFALDAVMALRSAHGLGGDDVEKVEIVTIPFAVRMGAPAPPSSLAARFSIPWAVAAALVRGRTDPSAFDERALADLRIRALAQRVEIRTDPDMTPRRADAPTAHVRLVLRGGRTLERTTSVVRGDALSPVPRDEITAKFVALAGPLLGEAGARKVVDVVEEMDTLGDVGALTGMLAR